MENKYRQTRHKQCELSRKLDKIAEDRVKQRKSANKLSYCMHIPAENIRKLEGKPRMRY